MIYIHRLNLIGWWLVGGLYYQYMGDDNDPIEEPRTKPSSISWNFWFRDNLKTAHDGMWVKLLKSPWKSPWESPSSSVGDWVFPGFQAQLHLGSLNAEAKPFRLPRSRRSTAALPPKWQCLCPSWRSFSSSTPVGSVQYWWKLSMFQLWFAVCWKIRRLTGSELKKLLAPNR